MEQLRVVDALDERDFLRKKIQQSIRNAKFVGCKRKRDNKVGSEPADDFSAQASSSFNSIKDLIKRYQDIDVAIVQANATTEITLKSGRTMTRAAAIALKKSLSGSTGSSMGVDFTAMLLREMTEQRDNTLTTFDKLKTKADNEVEAHRASIVGRDNNKKMDENDITMLHKLTEDLYPELIDPIKINEQIDALSEEHNTLIKELDTAIKVSNATTFIEI